MIREPAGRSHQDRRHLMGYDSYLQAMNHNQALQDKVGFYGEIPYCLFAVRNRAVEERRLLLGPVSTPTR